MKRYHIHFTEHAYADLERIAKYCKGINFIDGTVEGTDIGVVDTGNSDHTYFGNGCPNEWGTAGDGGSTKSCTTNIVDADNEEKQFIGVYYNFQAATSGSGRAIVSDNANAPDTFCPLGWQLPYGGTGGDYYDKSKSLKYLFSQYVGGSGNISAVQLLSFPFSYVKNGYYRWDMGRLYFMTRQGMHWTITNNNGYYAYALYIPGLSGDAKPIGNGVRCVFGIGNLEKLSMASA